MSDTEATTDFSRSDDTTFGAKLDALIGVVGHRVPASHVTGVFLAERLKVSPEQFSRKRTGNAAVNERDLCVIIDLFGIGSQVDYRVFQEPNVAALLDRLKEAGVGTYGANQRYGLCQLLYNASRGSRCSVRFSRIINPRSVRGPLGLAANNTAGGPVLMVGGRVIIECTGPEGRNLVVLTASREADISILMPSLFAPDTRMAGKVVTLPTAPDFDYFDVLTDPGEHRLYAVWTDDQVVGAIRENLDPLEGVKKMDDRTAGAIARLISNVPKDQRTAAACEYTVER